jgi:hypothetical protein
MTMTIDEHEHIGSCSCGLKTRDWEAIHRISSVQKGAKRSDTERAKVYQCGTVVRIDIKNG